MKIKYLLKHIFSILLLVFLAACDEGSNSSKDFDVIISNGTLYDGLGNDPVNTDIGIIGDSIAQIGNLKDFSSSKFIDATDMSVAPGFINMLSWATQPLLIDGRALSDIKQGVTLEIMGEGSSMGPLNDSMKVRMKEQQSNIKYDITWTTLNEYLERIVSQGVSVNVASYIGASTVRVHEIGYENRKPTATELIRMQNLVETAMLDGAMGVGSSLIYTPGT
ncbi:MAG: N-acyl-D-amino-acid deacylase, partial [Woeseiaceae bacterium]